MSVSTLADERIENEAATDRGPEDLVEGLESLADVEQAGVVPDYPTPRVAVELIVANVTESVAAWIDACGGRIVPESVEVLADGTLAFEVEVAEAFKAAGSRDARKYGESSVSVTFTRESLDLSGVDVDTGLDVWARDGAILFTTHEG